MGESSKNLNDMNKPLVGALCAVLGLAAGFAAGLSVVKAPAEPAAPESPKTKAAASRAIDADLEAQLRGRIRELESRLAEKPAAAPAAETLPAEEPPREMRDRRRGRRHGPPRPPIAEELAELEKTDPEEYSRVTNFMAHMERNIRREHRRQEERKGIIASVDASLLSPEQQQVHERYQELLSQMEEAQKAFRPDAEGVTDEEREAQFNNMRELGRELRELQAVERENLVSAAIASFGVEGDSAVELAETIKAVYEATSSGGRHHGPPPR